MGSREPRYSSAPRNWASQGPLQDPNPSLPNLICQPHPKKKKDKATHAEAWRAASWRIPLGDVIKAPSANRVQHGVEETQRRLSRCNVRVVQKRDDARESRRRGRRAADEPGETLEVNEEPSRLRRDVRVCLRERKRITNKCERLI